MKSTLIEPPPDFDEGDEEGIDFIRTDSIQELAKQTNIGNKEVLDRVLLPGKRFGSYHIIGFVAAGGMGEIYAARRIKSDGSKSRPVALKVITAEFANDWRIIERFKREAKISKAIRSRHVTRVYEFGESPQGHAFLAMELLSGEELFDRLYRHHVLSPMRVAELTLQILKGLHKIHETGFVHRDIKPENVFLARNQKDGKETVKIIDFGIAKRAANKSDPLLSVAGQIYGTPQYIAPEQAVNPDVDHRADLYSVGILMYECVTGSLPFEGESSYETVVAHQTEDIPPLPSSVDPEFADIIYCALAKTPEERFQSAVEMGRVIKRWLDNTSWVEDSSELTLPNELELTSIPDEAPSTDELSQAPTQIDDDAIEASPHARESIALEDSASTADEAPVAAMHTPPSATNQGPDSGEMAPLSAAPDPSNTAKDAEKPAPKNGSLTARRAPPSTDEIPQPSVESNSELRSPRTVKDGDDVTESDARTAQIVTGIALGLLILAILGFFLI